MAKATKKNSVLAKIHDRARKGYEEHREDDTVVDSNVELPPGINNGIAQLSDIKFDTYKSGKTEGEPFFMATGIVKEPKAVGKIPVEGLRTRIGPEPLCDTTGRSRETVEEHLAWIMNELRKLGVDTKEVDFDDLEETLETLREEKPHFRFRTWQGEVTPEWPNPRVNHNWNGIVEYEEDGEADDVVDKTEDTGSDEDEDEEGLDGEAADAGDVDAQKAIEKAALAAKIDPEKYDTWEEVVEAIGSLEEASDDDDEGDDDDKDTSDISIQDLGDLADDGDDECIEKLTALAEEAEVDPDEYDTWADLAKVLVEKKKESADDDWVPEKGEVYLYRAPRSKKQIEVEVRVVSVKDETVTVKCLDDGKVLKGIPWSALENV